MGILVFQSVFYVQNILSDAKEFLKTPFNKFLVLFLILVGLNVLFFMPETPADYNFINQNENATLTIDFFFHPACPHCKAQMPFNAQLMAEYKEIKFIYHDTSTESENKLLTKHFEDHGLSTDNMGVPATFIDGEYIIGFDSADKTGARIKEIIDAKLQGLEIDSTQNDFGNTTSLDGKTVEEISIDLPLIGTLRPAEFSLVMLAIILGLIDGFNPCAMWVLVYLISIVVSLKDRSRLWLIVGSFVFASGALYFLFMTAWLNAFLFVGYFRPVTVLVGAIALGGGILSLKEFIQNPKGTLECKVTGAEDRKKTISSINSLVSAPLTLATIAGIILLAFTINSIEFVCSAAIPAVFTQVLALSNLSGLEYYFYIFLYTLAFMFDDLLIFGLAAFAISSDIGQKYAGYCHVIGGAIMFLLGIMLLFFPSMLA